MGRIKIAFLFSWLLLFWGMRVSNHCLGFLNLNLLIFMFSVRHYNCNLTTLSDFIWSDIKWALEALAPILMSARIKSDHFKSARTFWSKKSAAHCRIAGFYPTRAPLYITFTFGYIDLVRKMGKIQQPAALNSRI